MTTELNDLQKTLLASKNVAHLATINPDGSAQVTPVWFEYDGTHLVFNTEQKRLKARNLARDPRVTLTITDAANPYQYVEIRGRVVESFEDVAAIDRLSQKYIGQEKYPWSKPGDVRVTYKVSLDKVGGMG
jgi:PPOX class probable F420-dependent enzyme